MKKSLFLLTVLLTLFIAPLMAYSTNDDLYERMDEKLVVQLTDDAGIGAINPAVLDSKRETCGELVNSYLRGRYTVPMQPAPKLLADVEADILVEKLYSRRPNIEIPDAVEQARAQAMKILQDISRGQIQLEDQPDVQAGQFKTNKTRGDRKFDTDTLRRF